MHAKAVTDRFVQIVTLTTKNAQKNHDLKSMNENIISKNFRKFINRVNRENRYYRKLESRKLSVVSHNFRKFMNRVLRLKSKREYYQKDGIREKNIAATSKRVTKLGKLRKYQVFSYYCGGVIQCQCCGELMIEFLTIDHVEGRRKWNHAKDMSGTILYSWIIKNNFPDGFKVLCFNCNCAKGMFGICPHEINKQQKISVNNPPKLV